MLPTNCDTNDLNGRGVKQRARVEPSKLYGVEVAATRFELEFKSIRCLVDATSRPALRRFPSQPIRLLPLKPSPWPEPESGIARSTCPDEPLTLMVRSRSIQARLEHQGGVNLRSRLSRRNRNRPSADHFIPAETSSTINPANTQIRRSPRQSWSKSANWLDSQPFAVSGLKVEALASGRLKDWPVRSIEKGNCHRFRWRPVFPPPPERLIRAT